MLYIVLIIWFILGVHSAWFYIKRATQYVNILNTFLDIGVLIMSFLFPIIFHMITLIFCPKITNKSTEYKILFKKKEF